MKVTTIRLDEAVMQAVEMAARVDGISVSEFLRRAIAEHVAVRKASEEFRERLAARIAADQTILERLADR